MNAAHVHLMVNHLPIFGSILSLPLLGLAIWRRRELSILFGATALLTLAAVGAGVALRSGGAAEEVVEDLPGVSETLIEAHEERAETATALAVVTALGAIGASAWAWRRGSVPALGLAGVTAAAVITSGAMAWTGLAGGQIRHTEIRPDAGAGVEVPYAEGHESPEEEEREGGRDRD